MYVRSEARRSAFMVLPNSRPTAPSRGDDEISPDKVPPAISGVPPHKRGIRRLGVVGFAAMALFATTFALINTAAAEAPRAVVEAVRSAGNATGIDPAFLMAVAWKESRLDPDESNPRSSADGLFQFTSGTWMSAVRDFGGRHGIGHFADQAPDAKGRLRNDILSLRRNPRLSAALAAEMLRRDGADLAERMGRPVNLTDIYLTHRLGKAGAVNFLKTLARNPSAPSSTVVPDAGRSGRRTVAQAYASYAAELESQRRRFSAFLEGYQELAEAN